MQNWIKKKIIAQKKLQPIISSEENGSGIYIYQRVDEQGIRYFYCGLATNLFERQISHWNGFQRIDISMRKRGFYSEENPFGWKFRILEYCDKNILEEREQYWIKHFMEMGYQTYNLNYGGNKGKENTFDKERRGYLQGKQDGENKQLKEIRVFFDKYLDAVIKGKPNKIKERKLKEFMELIYGENETIPNETKN